MVSIAKIRGRATGVGSELALASDMRFGSREKAILSQWEVGVGLVPGGGPMARLPRLIGRGRALEVLLGSDDINGEVAELYGYINRALPDTELDGFVDALATRIASFDKQAIAETKRLANLADLPPDSAIQAGMGCLPYLPRTSRQHRPASRSSWKRASTNRAMSRPGWVTTRANSVAKDPQRPRPFGGARQDDTEEGRRYHRCVSGAWGRHWLQPTANKGTESSRRPEP